MKIVEHIKMIWYHIGTIYVLVNIEEYMIILKSLQGTNI